MQRTLPISALSCLLIAAVGASCGSSGGSGNSSASGTGSGVGSAASSSSRGVLPGASNDAATSEGTPVDGGTLLAGIADNPDHLDSGLSYTNQGWEILEATGNGLLTFAKKSGAAGNEILPDLATAMPTVSAERTTYTFAMRRGVNFSAPVSREVLPSDIKSSIERLFRIDSGGVGLYSGIVGADAYAKTRKGGISGIVADDQARTIAFHLTKPDGAFLNYIALPFAFAMPKGAPDKDVSTIPAWRVATGPYMISSYTPKQSIVLTRNPSFKPWSQASPNGHVDRIQVQIGVDPERAANLTAAGQLDFSFEPVAPDRFTELKARYPDQVHNYAGTNVTYFVMNERKAPFDKIAVRQAVNFALDRHALVKIFGGQGVATENIVPPGFGTAFKAHDLYPLDVAKAKALVQQSGTAGMSVTVWSHNTNPAPKAAQYMAGVLDEIGYHASVKTLDESVYWDTIATQKGDPQIAFNDWNQDYPDAQDYVDTLLNGEHIVDVGNNDVSNTNVPALNARIDAANQMSPGPARQAAWASLDEAFMRQDAGWAPFLNRTIPKYTSKRLHGLVFNLTYYELLPSMWLK